MNDLISRAAAIDALAEAMPSLTTPDGCGQFDHDIQVTDEAYVDCMRIIHDLPSAQPGCEDAVSREEIMKRYSSEELAHISRVSRKGLLDFVEQLPSVTPKQPGWIPCKTALPKEDGEYLATIHWKSGGYYTDLLIYKAYLKEWKNEDRIFGTVIAWQPKPKPYEGERDDNT